MANGVSLYKKNFKFIAPIQTNYEEDYYYRNPWIPIGACAGL